MMMNFEEFVKVVEDNIRKHLPEGYKDAEVQVQDIVKLNSSYTGLVVRKQEEKYAPTITLDDAYMSYKEGMSLRSVLEGIAEMILQDFDEVNPNHIFDWDMAKNKLFVRVSKIMGNEEILADVPYTTHEDLALTYHLQMEVKPGIISSTIVTNSMLDSYGISKEQLHQRALQVSKENFPANVFSAEEVVRRGMRELMLQEGMGEEEIQLAFMAMELDHIKCRVPLMGVTNDMTCFGASAIFYPGQMEALHELLGGNYFILPASIHEMMVIRDTTDKSLEDLKFIVTLNATQVAPSERLTDEVYHYSKSYGFEKASTFAERVA